MSKTLIVLIVGMLAVGCASTPTMKSVAGAYEVPSLASFRTVLLENGVAERYIDGNLFKTGKWKIVGGDMHAVSKDGSVQVGRVNPDDSITIVAKIDKDGKRTDIPKGEQVTLKKIK